MTRREQLLRAFVVFFGLSGVYVAWHLIAASWNWLLGLVWSTALEYVLRRLAWPIVHQEWQCRRDAHMRETFQANARTIAQTRRRKAREAGSIVAAVLVLDLATFAAGHVGGGFVFRSARSMYAVAAAAMLGGIGYALYEYDRRAALKVRADDEPQTVFDQGLTMQYVADSFRGLSQMQRRLAQALCAGLVLSAFAAGSLTSQELVSFARHGDKDVCMRGCASRDFVCRELRTNLMTHQEDGRRLSLSQLRTYAEYMLMDTALPPPCVCAQQFGVRRHLVSVRMPDRAVVHMFNAQLDAAWFAAWTGPAGDGTRRMSRTRETQQLLFADRDAIVEVQRPNAMRVLFWNESCSGNALTLLDRPTAWCIDACLDLARGVSIYEKTPA